ncbi:MAG: serine/threonine protein phosphatase [Oleiphilus sp.]|nr:MAG: serine/threonine protein phosphatase [Oleiphilus sp.]
MPVFRSKSQGYDLIGDVHGCALALERLLKKLGYQHVRGCYRHESRKVIFVGDIVDRGPRIREALHIVKDMVDQGQAEIVLGNHEYNAMCYCTQSRDGGLQKTYLREHNARNHRLIRETLEQFEDFGGEWAAFLSWFQQIPLFIEKEHFRVVHACWDQHAIERFRTLSPDHCLSEDLLHASSVEDSFEARLVDRLTRGTALDLPEGETILSKDGYVRKVFRTKFWGTEAETYNDVVFQPDPLPAHLVDRKLSAIERQKLLSYSEHERPVFVGHYWMSGDPEPICANVACLDYSAVKYGKLVAYRMDDEQRLDPAKFVWVDVVRS